MVRYTSAQGDWKHANQTHRGRLRSRLDDRLAWPSSSVGHRIAAGPIHFRLCGFPIRRRPAGFPAGRLYIGGVPTKEFGTMAPFPIVKDCVKASKPPTGATLPNHVTSSSQCRDAHGEPRGASQKAAILAAILQTPSGHPIAAGPIHFRLCGFPIRRRPAGFPAGRLYIGGGTYEGIWNDGAFLDRQRPASRHQNLLRALPSRIASPVPANVETPTGNPVGRLRTFAALIGLRISSTPIL